MEVMKNYSEKFKNQMRLKMMGPSKTSARQLSGECGVSASTLSKWLLDAKTDPMKSQKRSSSRQKKRWTLSEKLRVLISVAVTGETGKGDLLRREGLHDSDLERFESELTEGVEAKGTPADKRRIKGLERELRRKEKALAEATALVVLSKKIQAYFGADEVGSMEEKSDS